MLLHDVQGRFLSGTDRLTVQKTQAIEHSFLEQLADQRQASTTGRAGEMHRVAAVPVVLVEKYLAQGIPFYSLSAREIAIMLKADGHDQFLATRKAV